MWILGIILAVLLVLSLLPVGLTASYSEQGTCIQARLGLIRIQILPKREKRFQRRKKKAQKQTPKDKKRSLSDLQKGGSLELLKSFLPIVTEFVGGLRQKLTADELELCAWVGGQDPCARGIHYGNAWAVLGTLAAVFENLFVIRSRNLHAELSSQEPPIAITARLTMHLHLYQVLALLCRYGLRAVRVYTKHRKKQKQAVTQTA